MSLNHTPLFHSLLRSTQSHPNRTHLTAPTHSTTHPHPTTTSPFITSCQLIIREFESIERQVLRPASSSQNAPNLPLIIPLLHSQLDQLTQCISPSQTHTQQQFYKAIIRQLKSLLQKKSEEWHGILARNNETTSLGYNAPGNARNTSSNNAAMRDSEFMMALKRRMREEGTAPSLENVPHDEQLESQMLRERQFIQSDLLDETQDIMHSALELSELNAIFMQKAREQYEQIETMHQNVEVGVHNVERATQELGKADRRQAGAWCSRFWVAYVFLVCSALLLLMDFVHW